MFKNILVGVDGSEHSLRAVEKAAELARSLGAHLVLVTAFDPIPAYLGSPYLEEAMARQTEKAEEILEKAKEHLGGYEDVETEAIEGAPADVILSAADVHNTDLIVLGTRGISGIAALLLGSEALKVASHAKCPVMLVH